MHGARISSLMVILKYAVKIASMYSLQSNAQHSAIESTLPVVTIKRVR